MATIRRRRWTTASGEPRERWQVDFTDQAGKRRAKQFARKRDADAFMVAARHRVDAGIYTPESRSVAFREAAERWLEHGRARGLEPATLLMYAEHVAHLLPLVGTEKLARLSRPSVERLADELRQGWNVPTARKILQSFGGILREAVRIGWLAHDPAAGVRIAANGRHQRRLEVGRDVPSPSEVSALLAATEHPKWKAFLALAAYCGLRASELRGLKWEHVDLGRRPSVTVAERADRYGTAGPPKSASARRSVPLGELTVRALREWKIAQEPGRRLVFGTAADRPEHVANIHRRVLTPAWQRAGGARYTLHSLRHFAISRWLAAGLDLKLVQQLAGHGTAAMTLDRYGHLIPRHDDHERVAAVETAL